MTDLDVYQPAGGIGQYQAGIVMTPESAKALDEQVRLCTKAVLKEGIDYGHIPGTSGDEKTLYRPGAQKLLQWFRLGCTCERTEVERGEDGRKHGITYRAEVKRRHPDGSYETLATCEGTADYDESKFYQPEEQVKARLRDQEHKWAAKDRRVPNADRWNSAKEWRADWNALMKRAQKRAIVGAVVDATAAGGIFTDREEDDSAPVTDDGGPSWYEQAIEAALTSTETEPGGELQALFVGAAQAHRDGLIGRRQQDHVQNTIRRRLALLKTAAPVSAEDLARQAGEVMERRPAAEDDTRNRTPSAAPATAQDGEAGDSTAREPAPRAAGAAPDRGAQPPPPQDGPPEDQPGSVSPAQLTKLHTVLTGLGFNGEDREQKLVIAEVITRHDPLTGPEEGRTSKNLSLNEARKLIDTLDGFADRDALIAHMAERKQAGDGDE